jgi:hypothetical protein
MAEMKVGGGGPVAEVPEVSKEELAHALEVMQGIVKTSKGLRMYLANNPLLGRFQDELRAKMTQHLQLYGDYRLDVDQFELRYKGKQVYENRDPQDSMAFKMYSDGIRFLIFCDGIEEYELSEFLDIVGKDRPSDVDDDIVTLLWERNLPHLVYVLADNFLEFDSVGSFTAPESQQEKITGIVRSLPADLPPPAPLLVPQKILTLADDELEWLRQNREAEEKRKPLDEVIQIVSSILVGVKEPEMFADFLDIMVKLTGNLVVSGEVRYLFSLVKFLRNLANHDQMPPVQKGQIDTAIGRIFSEDAVKTICRHVDTTELMTPEELSEGLRLFGPGSIPRMCELLGLVEKMKMRKPILQVLIEAGRDRPEDFFPFFSDQRWYLVRNLIFIMTHTGSAAALEQVVAHISHRELAVRKEVLGYLEQIPDPKAKTFIVKFLRDEASPLRIRALQLLAQFRCTFALKTIAAMATSEQFAEREPAEKRAIYEALGDLGGEEMLPMFREMLGKRFWFNKAKEKESALCAVYGLARVRSAAAVPLLEEVRKGRSDEVGEAAARALQAMAVQTAASGSPGREGA